MNKISFTMADLINADPCLSGLDRLTRGLGTYSGLTTVTLDHVEHARSEDILWALQLTDLSDHDQKMIAVKTAVYAAEQIKHLGDLDTSQRYIDTAQAWVDDPCESVRTGAMMTWRGAEQRMEEASGTARLVMWVVAKSNEGAPATLRRAGVVVSPTDDADYYRDDVLYSTKAYLIQLLKDHDHG